MQQVTLDGEQIRESVRQARELKRENPYPYPRLDPAALIGLPGDFVGLVAPQTEADPAALLVQFLTALGNAIGRTAYYEVEATRHYGNIFSVAVGPTAAGRKGTAKAHVERAMEMVEGWKDCVKGGLSSGEGLIHAVRDATMRREPIKRYGRVIEYQDVEADAGVADKRLLVYAPEFSQTLKVASREGNTLSDVIRQAWDTGDLCNLSKNSSQRATGAHVSIIAHISQLELLKLLARTDCANGFANRFLWYCTQRSKLLPEGGAIDATLFAYFASRVTAAVSKAQQLSRICLSPHAREIWHKVYPVLSRAKPGLLGAVISRAEAQTVRLSVIYAALRCSKEISAEDLTAALAVWEYCEQSARFIFGGRLGDPVADKIIAALGEHRSMTRTQIADLFNRHRTEPVIAAALDNLRREGLAEAMQEDTGGRPIERWRAVSSGSERSEIR